MADKLYGRKERRTIESTAGYGDSGVNKLFNRLEQIRLENIAGVVASATKLYGRKLFATISGGLNPSYTNNSYDNLVLSHNPSAYLTLAPGGNGVIDKTGNNHNGSRYGQTSTQTMPNGDVVTKFLGNEYIEIPDSDVLSTANSVGGDGGATGIICIEFWFSPSTLQFARSQGSGYVYIGGKNTPGEAENSQRIYNFTNSENRPNRISGYGFNRPGGLGAGSYFQDPVTVGEWIHYFLVINTTYSDASTTNLYPTGYTKIYKNGVLRDQDSLIATNADGDVVWDIRPNNGAAPYRLGSVNFNSWFEGGIGKLAFYNYELTPTQIASHYRNVVPYQFGNVTKLADVGTEASTTVTTPNTLTVTVPAGVTIGVNKFIVIETLQQFNASAPTIVDSGGHTYTRDSTGGSSTLGMRDATFRTLVTTQLNPGNTFTITFPAGVTDKLVRVTAYNNILTPVALDGTGVGSASANSGTAGTAYTSTNTNTLLSAHVAVGSGTATLNDEVTLTNNYIALPTVATANMKLYGWWKPASEIGTHNTSTSLSSAQQWIARTVAWRGA